MTLGPANEMEPLALYLNFLYLSSCTMGAVMYGDIIPFALSEQLFTFVCMFSARIFLAFLFAESAAYLGSLHEQIQSYTGRLKFIKRWMKGNNFHRSIVERVSGYHKILWEDF